MKAIDEIQNLLNNNAVQIAQVCKLTPASQNFLKESMMSVDFIKILIHAELYADVIKFYAHAFNKIAAINWAYFCLQSQPQSQQTQSILAAVYQWLVNPSEAQRQIVNSLTETLDYKLPEKWLALAVFWNDGSIIPPPAPAVAAGPYLTAKAVTSCVLLTAIKSQPTNPKKQYRTLIDLADAINSGKQLLINATQ